MVKWCDGFSRLVVAFCIGVGGVGGPEWGVDKCYLRRLLFHWWW